MTWYQSARILVYVWIFCKHCIIKVFSSTNFTSTQMLWKNTQYFYNLKLFRIYLSMFCLSFHARHFMPHSFMLFSTCTLLNFPFIFAISDNFLSLPYQYFLTFFNYKAQKKKHSKVDKLHSLHMRGVILTHTSSTHSIPVGSQTVLCMEWSLSESSLCAGWKRKVYHTDISQTSLLQSLNIALPLDSRVSHSI